MSGDEHGAWPRSESPVTRVRELEGLPINGQVTARTVAHTPTMLVLDVEMTAGTASAPHIHDSDSAGVLLAGRVRATVAGEEVVLEPGDGFHHPRGVEHHVEALEDSRWIEVKSPPTRPW